MGHTGTQQIGMSMLLVLHVLWFKELIDKGLRELRGGKEGLEIPDMCAPAGTMHQKHA